LLRQVHHAVVVGVRLVQLHRGELGVVARADALVPAGERGWGWIGWAGWGWGWKGGLSLGGRVRPGGSAQAGACLQGQGHAGMRACGHAGMQACRQGHACMPAPCAAGVSLAPQALALIAPIAAAQPAAAAPQLCGCGATLPRPAPAASRT
jgi:hypothetical protein